MVVGEDMDDEVTSACGSAVHAYSDIHTMSHGTFYIFLDLKMFYFLTFFLCICNKQSDFGFDIEKSI